MGKASSRSNSDAKRRVEFSGLWSCQAGRYNACARMNDKYEALRWLSVHIRCGWDRSIGTVIPIGMKSLIGMV
jgi:hypothetical protein